MKALLVNGSPHPRGCTYTALTELKNTLKAEGIEVELLHVGNKDIHGCIACRKCAQTGKCVFDDVVNEVAPKLAEADAFVIGCPVYFASPAGGAISFMVSFIELYPEKRDDKHLIKTIHFTFPVTYDGESGALFVRTNEQHVETVVLLSRETNPLTKSTDG